MDTRDCRKCGITQPLTEYSKGWNYKVVNHVKTDIRMHYYRGICDPVRKIALEKTGHKETMRQWYISNKSHVASRGKKYRANNKDAIQRYALDRRHKRKDMCIEYKGGKCNDCNGVFHRAVYDFHHLDPTQKDFRVSSIIRNVWETVTKELDKCVLLCANCHRIRHSIQENY